MKSLQIAYRLMRQNRVLFLILMLWPYAMAAILLLPGDGPDPADVLSMLHQECFYGLALVAVTASTQLGNEQRSRRILLVLSRAVSRTEYLLAILLTAWLPLLLYGSGFLVSGVVLARSVQRPVEGVLLMMLLQITVGVLAGAIGIFWSVILPSIMTTIAASASLGLLFLAGQWNVPGPGRLLAKLISMRFSGTVTESLILDGVMTVIAAGVVFAAASWLFHRRDLNLTAD